MRAKVIIPAFVLALVILLPAIYIRIKPNTPAPTPEQQPVLTAAETHSAAPTPSHSVLNRVTEARPQDDVPTHSVQFASDPDELKAQLIDLGMSGDPANLKPILSQLENQNPEIRQSALSATVDFGSKDAIPTLQKEMDWASDPEEKVAIKKAIEFLQLPRFGSGGDVTQQSSDPSAPNTN